jgi:O-antigen/teichoic acid export membrane protein
VNIGGHLSARTFVRNLTANWVGLTAEVVVAFVLTPFILGRLGLAAYGVWGVLNSLVGYMGLVDLGVRGSLGRFVNFHLARKEAAAAREVVVTSLAFLSGMAGLAVLVAIVLGVYFGEIFPKTPPELIGDATVLLPLMAAGLWLSFVAAVMRTVIAAFDRFDLLNLLGLAVLAVRAVGTVLVLGAGFGLKGLVLVTVGANVFAVLTLYALARHLWVELRLQRQEVKWSRFSEVWRFGLVAFGSRTASTLAVQTGPIIAMSVLGPKAVGVYSVAMTLIQNCQRLVEQMSVTLYPTIMKLGGTGDMAAMRSTFVFYSRLVLVVGGLLYFGVIVFAGPFIELWLGSVVAEAAGLASILAVAEISTVFTSTAALTLFSLGRLRAQLAIALVHAAGIIAVSLLLTAVLGLGLQGLALGVLIPSVLCYGIAYPAAAARAMQLETLPYLLATALRLAVVALVAVLSFEALKQLLGVAGWRQLMVAITVATFVYLATAAPLALGLDGVKRVRSILRR